MIAKTLTTVALSAALAIGLPFGWFGNSDDNEAEETAVIETSPSDEMKDEAPDADAASDEQAAGDTADEKLDGDEVVTRVNADRASLSETQKNSMAMLNYLAVVTEDINESKSSRIKLEETYSTLINNTHPNAVDDRTLAQLEGLLDTIEGYRMVDVKRDRLEYIYEQNQAEAMRAAVPNPLGLLSAVESGSLVKLAASVVYMAVDSYSSYQSASSAAELAYLKGGWELDDQEQKILHERRKDTFAYMVRTVNDYELPGYLALNEESVKQLVEYAGNSNVTRRIRFLESSQGTYRAYGGYWLILANSYYEDGKYQQCLDALKTYESLSTGILRKDYDYAKAMPIAIVAASETMNDDDYVAFAEDHVAKMVENSDNTDWQLLYFAAQTYVDLYARTNSRDYLQRAYEVVLDNVNLLVDKQLDMNKEYLDPIREADVPDGATKKQKGDVKQYNKMLKEARKTALPPIYQPLAVNCDLLFALADELDVSEDDRAEIEGILHPDGKPIFLCKTVDDRYRFEPVENSGKTKVDVKFDGTKLTLPASLMSASTAVEAKIKSAEEQLPGEWKVNKVDRGASNDTAAFAVTLQDKDAKGSYKDGDIVTFTLTDGDADTAVSSTLEFKVSVKEKWGPIPDEVSFEQVKE